MKDRGGTREQLLKEVAELRHQVAELKASAMTRQHIANDKRTQQKLKETEQRFSYMFHSAGDGLIFLSKSGKILDLNKKTAAIYGGTREELLGKHFAKIDIFSPGMISEMLLTFKAVLAGQRPSMTFTIKNKLGEEKDLECSAELVRAGKRILGLTIVARDITERRQAEKRETLLAEILEHAPFSVIATDEQGNITHVNHATERLFGYTRRELNGKNPAMFNAEPNAGEIQRDIMETVRRGKVWRGEMLSKKKNGELFSVGANVYRLIDTEGNLIAMVGFQRDITERKQTEQALRESEERFRIASQIASDVVYERDIKTGVATFYGDIDSHLGYEPGEYPHTMEGWREHVHPEDLARIDRQSINQLEPGVPYSIEYRMRKKDGTYMTWLDSIVLINDAETGRPLKFVGAATDITERKHAEGELANFKAVIDNASYGVAIGHPEKLTYINRPFAEMHGYSPDELIGQYYSVLYTDEQLPIIDRLRAQLLETGSFINEEVWHKRKDGTVFPALMAGNLIRDEKGNPSLIAGTVIDITERKQIEKELAKFKTISDNGRHGASITSLSDDKLIYVNHAYAEMHGYELEELIGQHSSITFTEAQYQQIKKKRRRLLAGETHFTEEVGRRKKDGTIFFTLTTATVIEDERGQPMFIAATLIDITERKKMEEALRESEERLAQLYDEAPVGYHELDREGRMTRVNRTELDMLGYTAEEMLGRHVWDFMVETETSRKAFSAKMARTMLPGQAFERTYRRKDGTTLSTLIEDRPVRDKSGQIIGLRSTIQDITERKQAGEALKESEERYRALVNLGAETGEAVVMLQDDERGVGMHVFASEAWSRITGYSVAELLNISMADLIHPRDRAAAVARHKRRIQGDELAGLYEISIIRKDGTEVPVEVTYAFSNYRGKRANVGYIRDITERKKAEEALQLRANLLNNATDSIMAADLEGNIIYTNDTACRAHGYTKEEMLEMNLRDTVPPSQAGLVSGRVKKVIEDGNLPFESEHRRKDGSTFPVEITSRTIRLGDKTLILSVQRDTTERKKAEAALRESEEFNSNVLRNSPNPVLVANPDTSIRYVNPALEELTGYSLDEIIGQKLPRPWWPEEFLEDIEHDAKLAYRRGFKGLEHCFKKKSGERFWVQITATPVFIDGEFRHFIDNWVDTTERKQAEEALRESEEKYRLLVENQIDLMIKVNTEGEFQFVSPSYSEMFGMNEDKLLGRKFMPLVHEDDREITARAMESLYKPPHTCYVEQRALTKYGWRWLAWSDKAVLDGNNNVVSIVGVGRDITDRKSAEEEYQTIVRTAMDGFWFLDMQGHILDVNDAFCHLIGYSRDELLNMSIPDIEAVEKSEETAKHIQKIKEVGRDRFETRHRCKDGAIVDVEISVNYMPTDEGRLFVFVRDITERKKLEEEHQRATKLESLGTLAGGIAHDFNNLLTGILGNISLAKRYVEPDSKASVRLGEAEKASIRARDLTQQLLTFSRGGAPIKKLASIGKLLADATTFALRGTNIRPEFSFAPRTRPVDIDEGQINQVLTNLIINACDAMPQGGTLQVGARNLLAKEARSLKLTPGHYIEVTVSDQGVGIPPEHIDRIFEPYFTTKTKGSGLGLATVYSIIKNHDGHITVESEVGKGTTFYIYLPAAKGPLTTTAEIPADVPIAGRGKILVMDDEDIIREFLYHELTDVGYEVTITSDGTQAIQEHKKAKNKGAPFDAVILDLTVSGGMGGKEAIKQLREIDPKVRAIASSGYATDPIMSNHRKYGFRAVVAKPYRVDELEKTLQGVLKPRH